MKTEHQAWLEWAEYVAKLKNNLIHDFRAANYGKIHSDKMHGSSNAYADEIINKDTEANRLMIEWYKHKIPTKGETP